MRDWVTGHLKTVGTVIVGGALVIVLLAVGLTPVYDDFVTAQSVTIDEGQTGLSPPRLTMKFRSGGTLRIDLTGTGCSVAEVSPSLQEMGCQLSGGSIGERHQLCKIGGGERLVLTLGPAGAGTCEPGRTTFHVHERPGLTLDTYWRTLWIAKLFLAIAGLIGAGAGAWWLGRRLRRPPPLEPGIKVILHNLLRPRARAVLLRLRLRQSPGTLAGRIFQVVKRVLDDPRYSRSRRVDELLMEHAIAVLEEEGKGR